MIIILDKNDVRESFIRRKDRNYRTISDEELIEVFTEDTTIPHGSFLKADAIYFRLLSGKYKVFKSRRRLPPIIDKLPIEDFEVGPVGMRYFLVFLNTPETFQILKVSHTHIDMSYFKSEKPNNTIITNIIEITKFEFENN